MLLRSLVLIFFCSVCNHVYSAILRVGNPLQWHQSKPYLQYVRLSGVDQFISHYKRCEGIELPLFVWGDEIEYGVFRRNSNNHYDLAMNATKIRESLIQYEKKYNDLPIGCEWQPEYGSWMVEAVPRSPYGSYVSDLLNVEKSMQLRRKRLHFALQPNEIAPTTSNFPMLGVEGYEHSSDVEGAVAQSRYISDRVINPHPRFAALTRNIRMRRGSNVEIEIPKATENENEQKGENAGIKMDAMAFGMGCCCLQVTMQVRNEAASRYLHDQLLVLGPILQALSAATPIFKGQLAATDTRWEVIAQAVDDRTPAERGLQPDATADPALAGDGIRRLQRSRYSGSCLYFAEPQSEEDASRLSALNDISVDIDDAVFQRAIRQGIDPALATHLAHLFTRDPLVIFDDAIALDNSTTLDHFENIQSTNWRSMRWKPPALRLGLSLQHLAPQPSPVSAPASVSVPVPPEPLAIAAIPVSQSQSQSRLSVSSPHNDKRPREETRPFRPPSSTTTTTTTTTTTDFETEPQSEFDADFARDEDNEEAVDVDFDHNILVEDRDQFVFCAETETETETETEATTAASSASSVQMRTNNNHAAAAAAAAAVHEDLQSLGPGWRVEFRPLEVQLTDFENAAFAMFVVLLSRSLLAQRHSFYLPMSLVEENMRRAQLQDAARTQRFYFRRNSLLWQQIGDPANDCDCTTNNSNSNGSLVGRKTSATTTTTTSKACLPRPPLLSELEIVELSIDEILNGEKPRDNNKDTLLFPGLIPLVQRYMSSVGCDDSAAVSAALKPYLDLLRDRARGSLPTTARYLRDFVLRHADYARDGRVTPGLADELLRHCDDVGMGRVCAPGLYGAHRAVLNLDAVDDEDLMFTNSTCFVRPVVTSSNSISSISSRSSSASVAVVPADALAPGQQSQRAVISVATTETETETEGEEAGLQQRTGGKRALIVRTVRALWQRRPWRRRRESRDDHLRF